MRLIQDFLKYIGGAGLVPDSDWLPKRSHRTFMKNPSCPYGFRKVLPLESYRILCRLLHMVKLPNSSLTGT